MKIGVKLSLVNAMVIVIIMAVSITFFSMRNIKQHNDEVLQQCRTIVKELVIMRVYLAESLSAFGDIILDEKMANFIPARAGYEIGNRFSKETGYLLKQTSLKLRNPANAPDEFESRILKRFEEEKKPKEYYEVITVNQEKFFLYMFPLEIKESCLKCHGDRENMPAFVKEHYKEDTATGYHLGDIRGAISVKVPYNAVLTAIWNDLWYLITVGFVTTGACIGVIFSLSRVFVSSPLQKLIKVSEHISKGDFSQDVKIQSNDEIGNLVKMFNYMLASLRVLNRQTQESIARISSVSVEMLSSSEEQASGTAELAASVGEITATMEELSSSAKQVAVNAESVAKIAEDSETTGSQGSESISESIHIMEEIKETTKDSMRKVASFSEKSQKIGDVLSMIREIASETHLLALNASIEASAAGEFGKRFGVVASEVRRLAERTKAYAEEIKNVVSEIQVSTGAAVLSIEQSVKNVDKGVEVIRGAGQALNSNLGLIEKTVSSSRQIVMVTQQQRSATEQVAETMKEIAGVVKQSSAGLKQFTVAIADLNKLADGFKEMVGRYKT